mmetsp:Transcript_14834/g.14286  ORF Transcript_14834/g.14286 Transcript_14834/m.14286 type:complete len:688 (-) Transcript_14834:292-2355(-)
MSNCEEKVECEAEESEEEILVPSNFSIPIHTLLDEAQSSHGLVQNDYAQYHAYCTRRLDRLRHAKDVRRDLSHYTGNQNKSKGKQQQKGGGKHAFLPKTFSVEDYNRHINFAMVTLFSSERAWAHGMSIKSQFAAQNNNSNKMKDKTNHKSSPGSVRKHYLNRLKKAAKWSLKLDEMINTVGDEKTKIEVKCYRGWIRGSCALEMGHWKDACSEFHSALTICRALAIGEYGDGKKNIEALEMRDFFNARAENIIQPLLRYCQYELQAGGTMTEEDITALFKAAETEALESYSGNHKLKAKLQSIQQKKLKTGTMGRIHFREKDVPVENKDLKVALLKIADKKTDLQQKIASAGKGKKHGVDKKNRSNTDAKFMILLSEYDDAAAIVSADLKEYMSMKSGPAVNAKRFDRECLLGYVKFEKLKLLMMRNEKMVDELRQKDKASTVDQKNEYTSEASGESSDQQQDVEAEYKRFEQIAHLYDALMQDARAIVNLPGGGDSPSEDQGGMEQVEDEFVLEANAHVLRIRALRCYYLGQMYGSNVVGKYSEAIALFGQASSLAHQAAEEIAACQDIENFDTLIESMVDLEKDIEGAKCKAEAHAYLVKLGSAGATLGDCGRSLIHRLDDFDSGGKTYRLVDIPPSCETITCKPTFFDIANNYISEMPIDELQMHIDNNKKQSKSLLGWFLGS